jgi:hypothetical protein
MTAGDFSGDARPDRVHYADRTAYALDEVRNELDDLVTARTKRLA